MFNYKFQRALALSFIVLLFSGCNDALDYNYLMQHPKVLAKAFSQCHIDELNNCELVRKAAEDFSELVNEQRNEPEEFAERIMQAQNKCLAEQQAYNNAKKQGDAALIKRTKLAYDQDYQRLLILYAVVGMTPPD